MVVLIPDVTGPEDVPFYHPMIRKLLFHYTELPALANNPKQTESPSSGQVGSIPSDRAEDGQDKEEIRPVGTISISVLPFSTAESSTTDRPLPMSANTNSNPKSDEILPNRTFRTCLMLLETLYKHGYGMENGYQKRVMHDVRITSGT